MDTSQNGLKTMFFNPQNNRYYFMLMTINLFGEHEIIISRGSKQRKPILKSCVFTTYIDAMYDYFRLAKLRIKHGYKEI